jgi:hypothetical protein
MESWRKYLNEGIDPRIQKQLDNLFALPDVGIAVVDHPRASTFKIFKYVRIEDAATQQFSDLKKDDSANPSGAVEIMKMEEEQEGPCFDGYMVAGSEAEKGWGPLLYEVALEWSSQNGGGLVADRWIVSHHAQAVWDKYGQRGDVDQRQMDVSHEFFPKHMDPKNFPQLTPDVKADDCDQSLSLRKSGKGWHKDSKSKIYRKDTPEVMKALGERLIIV